MNEIIELVLLVVLNSVVIIVDVDLVAGTVNLPSVLLMLGIIDKVISIYNHLRSNRESK